MMERNKPDQKALIIVDMIRGFVNEGALADPYIGTIEDEIVRLTRKYLSNGDKVIAFKDVHHESATEFKSFPPHCIVGTSETELVDSLKPYEHSMKVIKKNSTNGFFAPGFIEEIRGIKDFVITGCCTDICVQNLAITMNNFFNQKNIPHNIQVPRNAVETFHNPEIGHDRHEMNEAAFKFMSQAGIDVVGGIELGKRKSLRTDATREIDHSNGDAVRDRWLETSGGNPELGLGKWD
ncbi:MAG: cysteine hydrolase [Firmicutes bacterium]|nr:cysteine hydrolase [Bacillota bacterium]